MNEQLDINKSLETARTILSGYQGQPTNLVDAFQGNSNKSDVERAFDKIPGDETATLKARYLANKSIEEYSQQSGKTPDHIKQTETAALLHWLRQYQGGKQLQYTK
jgi:DNA-directed RNA polymerase specialized sigma24 family protein